MGTRTSKQAIPEDRNKGPTIPQCSYRAATRHLQDCHRSYPEETRSASYIQPAIYASSPCDRQVGKHNIVPLSPRRLMIRLPTPKNRKRCLPPPGCHKLIHRALLRCQQTALVQILYNNHVSRGSPGSRFALTCIETIWLRNTRLVLERRERSQVHCPLLRTQG